MKTAQRFADVTGSDIRAVIEKTQALEAAGKAIAHFEIGRPDFDTPEPIKRATVAALEAGEVHYGPNAGIPELRKAVALHLRARYGLGWPDGRILITNGAIEAVYVSLMTVVNPGDEVLIPEPCWPYYTQMVRIMGGVPRQVPATFEGGVYLPDMAALEAVCTSRTRALLLNVPNNPTGADLDEATRAELASFVLERDLLLVADEVYESIRLDDAPFASVVQEPGLAERTALVSAFSKSHSMTGWRLGYVALPEPLLRPALLTHTYMVTSVNTFVQHGGIAALQEAHEEQAAMMAAYRERHVECLQQLNDMPGVHCPPSRGGFFVFPRFEDHPDDRALAMALLEEAHVATVPGSSFGPSGAGHLRLSFACEMTELRAGLRRMHAWLCARREGTSLRAVQGTT